MDYINWSDLGYCRHVKAKEVGVMHKISRGKATRPNEILMEFQKIAGRANLEWLTRLFNVIFRMLKIPEKWRWSTICNNYKGIKLLSYTMKV